MKAARILVPGLAILALAIALAHASPASPAPTGTLVRNEVMRREPFTDARAVMTLRTRARVTILERRGAWYRVGSGRRTGWIRMLSLRTMARPMAGAAASNPAPRAPSTQTGRSGTGGLVSTTGIRALDEGTLRAAVFHETESIRLEAQAVSTAQALRYASDRGLAARSLPYLPDPAAAARTSTRSTRQ